MTILQGKIILHGATDSFPDCQEKIESHIPEHTAESCLVSSNTTSQYQREEKEYC